MSFLETDDAIGLFNDKSKRELVLKYNKTMMGWANRPILSRKKGVVLGLETNDGNLAGAISLVPSYSDRYTAMDIISNIIKLGIPPTHSGKTRKKIRSDEQRTIRNLKRASQETQRNYEAY
jgi:hypothetical protein